MSRLPVLILGDADAPRRAGAIRNGGASLAYAFAGDALALVQSLPWARPQPVTAGHCADPTAAVERLLARAIGEARGPAIAISTATPGLPASHLDAARAALDRADAVIGATDDGGVYLLGLRRCPRGLLAELPWRRPELPGELIRRLRGRGLTVETIEPWFDVDPAGDLERLRALLRARVIHAPSTASLLVPRISAVVLADGAHELVAQTAAALDRVAGLDEVRAVSAGAAAPALVGDVVWLVRAGTLVPADADRHIADALLDPAVVAGAFATRPARPASGRWHGSRLQLAELRARLTRLPHGAQSLFVRHDALARAGGLPAVDDGDRLVRRLRRLGRISILHRSVEVVDRGLGAPVATTTVRTTSAA